MTTDTESVNTPKAALKSVAKESGLRLKDLIVLASQNDPFNCGGPEQIKQAKWFSDQWYKLIDGRAHIRKLFYKLVSQPTPVIKPDGTPFLNTDLNWTKLEEWAKYARYLGLVNPRDVIDNRNPEPHLFAPNPVIPDDPEWEIDYWTGFSVPRVNTVMYSDFSLPEVNVEGYHYQPGEQPYLIELWNEKSTMDEELLPICRQFDINLVPATGFQSITGSVAVYSRATAWAALRRPVRIFYLSDFDPAGDAMPVAVSRQLEFWYQQFGSDVDIKLTPLALTKEQVDEYDLPTIPIKRTDRRKDAFQERRDVDGAVELDALEAIHPGELACIVGGSVSDYRDEDLELRVIAAGTDAQSDADEAWDVEIGEVRQAAAELDERANDIIERYRPRLKQLSDDFDADMQSVSDDADALQEVVEGIVTHCDLMIALPPRPTATVTCPDESDWLFDAQRSFGEQLAHYRKHRGQS